MASRQAEGLRSAPRACLSSQTRAEPQCEFSRAAMHQIHWQLFARAWLFRPHYDRQQRRSRIPRDNPVSLTTKFLGRSEEHTSELQSHLNLVCRLLLEIKK